MVFGIAPLVAKLLQYKRTEIMNWKTERTSNFEHSNNSMLNILRV